MPIIRDKEAFFLHILGYLIELRDDYGIELTFVHTSSLKWELLKKLKMNWIFSLQYDFLMFHFPL